jgi:hypothetical protein
MTVADGAMIGKTFLEHIDDYVRKHWDSLTADDIAGLYSQFIMDLKEYKGNSNGFSGLSELLVFRFVYHLLGGNFTLKKKTHDLREFISNLNDEISIAQSCPLFIGEKRYYPDIVIACRDDVKAIFQIKAYVTGGRKEIDHEFHVFSDIHSRYPGSRCILVIFNGIPAGGKLFDRLENLKSGNPWFDYILLQGNNQKLKDLLKPATGGVGINLRIS